jgi:hypothetical protein
MRVLARAPRFAATVVVILALGIGLSMAVFTVADALLLGKLQVRDQNRLGTLWGETRHTSRCTGQAGVGCRVGARKAHYWFS